LGVDSHDNQEVFINKGPYGFYVMKKISDVDSSDDKLQEPKEKDKVGSKKSAKDAKDAQPLKKTSKTTKTKVSSATKKTKKKKNVKIVGLPSKVSPQDMTLEYAIKLLQLPKLLGVHPNDGLDITLNIGRYGPYLAHNKKFTPVKDPDFLEVSYDEALEIMAKAAEKKSRGKTSFKKKK
jgi:topoisomerase IA-like protein